MVVLRCTQRLLTRLKQVDDPPPVESTTRLGDWYGNIVRLGRRQVLMFISERSRLPVLIPIREASRLQSAFPDAACRMLSAVGLSAGDIEEERSRMSVITYGRTRSRSHLGTLNDFSWGAHLYFTKEPDVPLDKIARWLANTPIMPLKGACPVDLTRALFSGDRPSLD